MSRSLQTRSIKVGDNPTRREADVLELVGRGWLNKQIADKLEIGESGVKAHVAALLAKFGVTNRVQLALAFRLGPAWDQV